MSTPSESHGHTIAIKGNLDFQSVPARLRESRGWFSRGPKNDPVTIDLEGVPRADSAGVALLLEWMRDARKTGTTLQFANTPAQMQAIIDFCALGDVIPHSS